MSLSKFLIKEYGYKKDDWQLLDTIKLVSEALGAITKEKLEQLKLEVNEIFTRDYPEIAQHGQSVISRYFSQLPHGHKLKYFRKAVKKIIKT